MHLPADNPCDVSLGSHEQFGEGSEVLGGLSVRSVDVCCFCSLFREPGT